MGKRITGLFQPLIDAVDRTVAGAAETLVRNAGAGDSQGRHMETKPIPQEGGTNHLRDHRDSLRAFVDRRWHTNLHRRRAAMDRKRMRCNHNRVSGRPHG